MGEHVQDPAKAERKQPVPVLRGARVVLRGLEEKDIDSIAHIGIDAGIMRMFGVAEPSRPELTLAEAEARYRDMAAADPPLWAITVEDSFIGTAGYSSINRDDRRARYIIGIVDHQHLGRGLGTEVTGLVLAYSFDVLGLHRVDVRVLDHNERAIACYRKCGFTLDGRERESAFIDGEWHDDLIMSVLEDEYRGGA